MIRQAYIGKKLDSQLLYERQKAICINQKILPAPRIIASDLRAPENIGSVLRLADAAGSSEVIFVGETDFQSFTQKIHKTARNCENLVKWTVLTVDEFIDLSDSYQPLIALEITELSRSLFMTALPAPCSIVIGSERHGIPETILNRCREAVHVPMYGVNGSMNVTHALAIALFEWRRQQGF